MKATAATKCAPLRTRARAVARAANEHEEDTAPNSVARATLRHPGPPKRGVRRALGTNAWMTPLTEYPSTNAHPAFEKKPTAVLAASP